MTIQNGAKKALYASIGAGDLAVEKVKSFTGNVRDVRGYAQKNQRKAEKTFAKLNQRGEKLYRGFRGSTAAKRATEQTKVATRQVGRATTAVRKALGANVEATKTAAKKVG